MASEKANFPSGLVNVLFGWLVSLMKALVVHRQDRVVEMVRAVLGKHNPDVIYASSGLDALLTSRVEAFDLIVCGTDLPVVTGFELIRSLRTNSVNRNTPVVFITDVPDPRAIHLAQVLGVDNQMQVSEIGDKLDDVLKGLPAERRQSSP